MPSSGRDHGPSEAEVSAYAVGRWPVLVRCLVLLGAPPAHAGDLAVQAVARLLQDAARDERPDLDVALANAVVDVWEQDRAPWWLRPGPDVLDDPVVLDVLDALDALAPSVRARVVLGAVAGLTDAELDDVLGPAPATPRRSEDDRALALVAGRIEVGADRVAQAHRGVGERRRRARGLGVAGVAGGAAVVAAAVALALAVVDPRPGDDPSGGGGPSATGVATPASAGRDLTPVAWYDGRRVHLGGRSIEVPGVRAMVRGGGGVVLLGRGGQVLLARPRGALEPLGTAVGALAADPATGLVAWIDGTTGSLVLHRTGGGRQFVDVASSSRVVAVAGQDVYLDSPAGPSLVTADAAPPRQVRRGQDGLLDVVVGTSVSRGGTATVLLRTGPRQVQLLPGRDGWLSDDGALLLTRDVGSAAQPPSVVVDVGTGAVVELPVVAGSAGSAGSVVQDAAFGADGSVTFVLTRANGDGYPADWPRDGAYRPGYDLVVCDVESRACQQDARLSATDAAPLLAR